MWIFKFLLYGFLVPWLPVAAPEFFPYYRQGRQWQVMMYGVGEEEDDKNGVDGYSCRQRPCIR